MEQLDACGKNMAHSGSPSAPTPLARAYSPAPAPTADFGAAVLRRAARTTEPRGSCPAMRCERRLHATPFADERTAPPMSTCTLPLERNYQDKHAALTAVPRDCPTKPTDEPRQSVLQYSLRAPPEVSRPPTDGRPVATVRALFFLAQAGPFECRTAFFWRSVF